MNKCACDARCLSQAALHVTWGGFASYVLTLEGTAVKSILRLEERGLAQSIGSFRSFVKLYTPEAKKAAAMQKARDHAATIGATAWSQTSFGSADGFVNKFGETFDKNPDLAMKMIA